MAITLSNNWPDSLGLPATITVNRDKSSFIRGPGAVPGQDSSRLKHLLEGKATFNWDSNIFAGFEGFYEHYMIRGSRGTVIQLDIDNTVRTWVMYFPNGYTAKVNSGWGDVTVSVTIRLEEVM